MAVTIKINGEITEETKLGFIDDLVNNIEQIKKDKALLVKLDSEGGEVLAADHIGLLIEELKQEGIIVTTQAGTKCSSSAANIFCRGNIRMISSHTSQFVIHNPTGIAEGTAEEIKFYSENLELIQNIIVDFYVTVTNQPKEKLLKIMAQDRSLTHEEIITLGFAHSINSTYINFATKKHNFTNKTKMKGIWTRIKAMAKNQQEAKNITLVTNDGIPLKINAENAESLSGKNITAFNGEPIDDGVYDFETGQKINVIKGVISMDGEEELEKKEEEEPEELRVLAEAVETIANQVKDLTDLVKNNASNSVKEMDALVGVVESISTQQINLNSDVEEPQNKVTSNADAVDLAINRMKVLKSKKSKK